MSGPGFGGEVEIKKELLNHRVSGWTVSDLQTLLKTQTDALHMLPLFAPGFAADALDDLLWEQNHGQAKRVRIIAEALTRAGWTVQ